VHRLLCPAIARLKVVKHKKTISERM
jgi:hypothetical protein